MAATPEPEWLSPEDALMLTDAFSTGYFGAQLGEIAEGDTVAVFGAGPVGLAAARSAWFFGAGRVIVVDQLDYRLEKARDFAFAETMHIAEEGDIVLAMKRATGHLGADVAIDAVGAEADGSVVQHVTGAKLKLNSILGNSIGILGQGRGLLGHGQFRTGPVDRN